LRGSRELIAGRLNVRKHHFAGVSILDDQFATLEEPRNADVTVDIKESPDEIVEEILRKVQ
jgi:gluconokinase